MDVMNFQKISDIGISRIQTREELRLKAYRCEAGRLTIGYGHTEGVREGDEITEAQAIEFFKSDVGAIENHLNRLRQSAKITFRQCEFDALISLIFTIGLGSFQTSTLRKKLIAKATPQECAAEFKKWIYVTKIKVEERDGKKFKFPVKVISNGLKNRRESEYKQYLDIGGDYERASMVV